jgi:hypothetical protein
MLGAARAAAQLGEMELSQRYYGQLAETWQNAAAGHPFTEEVMAALAP